MPKARPKTKPECQVAVLGSLNLDYVTRVETLPKPGETVSANRFTVFRGGKGANQAIAVARQGCRALLLGAVGSDEGGAAYLRALEEEGIDVAGVRTIPGSTGAAFITVDRVGENTIVVSPGANGDLRPTDISRESAKIESCQILLAQFEVPASAVVVAVHTANRFGVPVVINPSPFNPTFPWEEVRTDYLIVNEGEAIEILGFPPALACLDDVLERLHELRTGHLIVTRGGEDTLVFSREDSFFTVPVLSVLPVDTVGAGDAFAGCFAARLAQGKSLTDALRAANCAGALTTLGAGAQPPIPDHSQVDRHLQFLDL